MSEITRAAIGMPFSMAMESELSRRQFHSIAQALLTERDQLRAEVAGLRTAYEAYERVNAELKAEVARFLGLIQEAADELRELKVSVGFRGHTLTVLQRIDAAIGQGEPS